MFYQGDTHRKEKHIMKHNVQKMEIQMWKIENKELSSVFIMSDNGYFMCLKEIHEYHQGYLMQHRQTREIRRAERELRK